MQREELGVVGRKIGAVFGEMAVGNVLALQTKVAQEVVKQMITF
jgi:hypothetical protein